MVGPYGEVVVMDWGIALHEGDRDPAAGRIVGTPFYMSPEGGEGGETEEGGGGEHENGAGLHEPFVAESWR